MKDERNGVTNPHLHDLAWGPSRKVNSFHTYFVNGYKFQTVKWCENRQTTNSGVWVRGHGSEAEYHGQLEDIVELEYSGETVKNVTLFYCKWFDPQRPSGTKVHPQYTLVDVRHKRQYGPFDPFVIPQTVRQVYYIPYPLRHDKREWWNVIQTKPRNRIEVEDSIEIAFQNEASSVDYFVDTELEDNLRDFQNENDDELETILSTREDDGDDDDDDNRNNSDEEAEFVDDEETSPEEEYHDVNSE